MKRAFIIATILLLLFGCAQENKPMTVIDESRQLLDQGQFSQAETKLKDAINSGNFSGERLDSLRFEYDRIQRIRNDFPLSKEDLFEQLKESIPDLTEQEFDQWIQEGKFDKRVIDGKTWFMYASRSNLFFRNPDIRARRTDAGDPTDDNLRYYTNMQKVKKAAASGMNRYVDPQDYRLTMTVTTDDSVAKPGETIRAWLPIPRSYPFQTDFQVESASSSLKWIDRADAPMRSAYFEGTANQKGAAEFKITYTYRDYAVYQEVSPDEVQTLTAEEMQSLDMTKYIQEDAPHIEFRPELKKLSEQIVGDETNPYLIAKKVYKWISANIQYSYAVEYSTILNIPTYCYGNKYGDCGQVALLFITLLRYNDIPARWQSSWFIMPGEKTIHDWAEMYIAPYGWLPVDPYMGQLTHHYMKTLSEEKRNELNDFYFGNIDHFRMAANGDYGKPLYPPKNSFRSDNVDFQRGELEVNGKNIYFNHFSYHMDIELLETPIH